MGWNPPRTWNPGETVTASLMNAHVRDNLNVLKTKIDDSGLLRTLYYGNNIDKGNTGVGEDDLHSFTLAANDLNGAAQGLRILTMGILANNTNSKTIRFRIGGVLAIDSLLTSSAAISANVFTLDVMFWRHTATVLRYWARATYNAATGGVPAIFRHFVGFNSSVDFTANQTVKFTGEGVADSDIVMHGIQVQPIR